MEDGLTAFGADLKARLGGSVRDIAQRAHFGKTTISELTSGKRLPHEDQLERLLLTAAHPADATELVNWQERRAAIETALAAERDRADSALVLAGSGAAGTEVAEVGRDRTGYQQVLVEDLERAPESGRPTSSHHRRLVRGLLFANAMVLLGVLLIIDLASSATHIAGTVRCADGSPVSGIYVKADDSRPGFAQRRRLESPSHVRFSYTLDRGGPWLVSAGCGGTGGVWATDSSALDVVEREWQDWVCTPVPRPDHGVCVPVAATS